jgi:hypothetical protein
VQPRANEHDEIAALLALYSGDAPPATPPGLTAHSQAVPWDLGEREARLKRVTEALALNSPEYSVREAYWTWQLALLTGVFGLVLGAALEAPGLARSAVTAVLALAFAFVVVWRLAALGFLVMRDVTGGGRAPSLPTDVLPHYSVLVPLYREAHMVAGLIDALDALDYPRDRLEVLLILEACDLETREAVAAAVLSPHIRAVIVPNGQPRTKPKALSYALAEARGTYIVVYDAEDLPDPSQLKTAAAVFATAPTRLGCLQAPLDIEVLPGLGIGPWLTRQFALEYAALFHGLLPVLATWQVIVPLGGTSNHFSRRALEAVGGWDPYNVTEDADLGVRLARHGWLVGVIAPATRESAPEGLGIWIRQRTRWLKGYMQTYTVHMRRPLLLFGQLGPGGFLAFHVVIGGGILTALVQPWIYAIALHDIAVGTVFMTAETAAERFFDHLAVINLVGGVLGAVALPAVAGARLGIRMSLAGLLSMPLYWLLASIAGYRAVYQLITDPHVWEKTPHAPHRRSLP